MLDVLRVLEDKARSKAREFSEDILTIRGIWRCDYVLRLSIQESVFNLHYVLVQTVGQGCSYYDPASDQPTISESLIGDNVLGTEFRSRALRVAALDAVYFSLNGRPNESKVIKGTNVEKAAQRATIVCNEALLLLEKKTPKKQKLTVLNVGVVGSFLSVLAAHKAIGVHPELDIQITASDLYDEVAGTQLHGVTVEHGTYADSKLRASDIPLGTRTLELIAEADVAIVTGMTLANGTIDGILETALKNKTALLIFAETGAHFAEEYCDMGVDTVVSEPFPFYLTCSGPTQIDIYRRKDR